MCMLEYHVWLVKIIIVKVWPTMVSWLCGIVVWAKLKDSIIKCSTTDLYSHGDQCNNSSRDTRIQLYSLKFLLCYALIFPIIKRTMFIFLHLYLYALNLRYHSMRVYIHINLLFMTIVYLHTHWMLQKHPSNVLSHVYYSKPIMSALCWHNCLLCPKQCQHNFVPVPTYKGNCMAIEMGVVKKFLYACTYTTPLFNEATLFLDPPVNDAVNLVSEQT